MERQRFEEARHMKELAQLEKRRQAEASFQAWLDSHKAILRAGSPCTYCISNGTLLSKLLWDEVDSGLSPTPTGTFMM